MQVRQKTLVTQSCPNWEFHLIRIFFVLFTVCFWSDNLHKIKGYTASNTSLSPDSNKLQSRKGSGKKTNEKGLSSATPVTERKSVWAQSCLSSATPTGFETDSDGPGPAWTRTWKNWDSTSVAGFWVPKTTTAMTEYSHMQAKLGRSTRQDISEKNRSNKHPKCQRRMYYYSTLCWHGSISNRYIWDTDDILTGNIAHVSKITSKLNTI